MPKLASTLVATAIAAVLLAGCGNGHDRSSSAQAQSATTAPNVDTLLSAMLRPAAQDSAALAIAALPKPDTSEAKTVTGPHGGTGEVITRHFSNVTVTSYRSTGQAQELIVAVTLLIGEVSEHSIGIGMELADAVNSFPGAAALVSSPDSVQLAVQDEPLTAPYQVDLSGSRGRLAAITWHAYLD